VYDEKVPQGQYFLVADAFSVVFYNMIR